MHIYNTFITIIFSGRNDLADMSIYFSTNTDNHLNYGPTLENLVYIYLRGQGYQVTYTLQGQDKASTEKIKEREYRPFRKIPDGYPRYIISLDRYRDQQEKRME